MTNLTKKYKKQILYPHNEDRMIYISGLLKEHRLWMGYSRVEMEEEFGISRATLQRAESSDPKNLTLKTVFDLLDIYEISPNELFRGIE